MSRTGGDRYEYTYSVRGDTTWRTVNGAAGEVPAVRVAAMRVSIHVEYVTSLTPLLLDRSLKLGPLDDRREPDGRVLAGVAVSADGFSDVRLYFDRATGLPAAVEYQIPDESRPDGSLAARRVVYGDYREPDWTGADERFLREAGLATDGPSLTAYLRDQVRGVPSPEEFRSLVRRLGDPSFMTRERATAALTAAGRPALPWLREAADDADPEVVRRAGLAARAIERSGNRVAAVVRLTAWKKPDGATAALRGYMPHADADDARELRAALAHLDPAGPAEADEPGRRLYLPGRKVAHRTIRYSGTEKEMELEYVGIEYFTRLDDGLFERPNR
jgi:hypothetical protein